MLPSTLLSNAFPGSAVFIAISQLYSSHATSLGQAVELNEVVKNSPMKLEPKNYLKLNEEIFLAEANLSSHQENSSQEESQFSLANRNPNIVTEEKLKPEPHLFALQENPNVDTNQPTVSNQPPKVNDRVETSSGSKKGTSARYRRPQRAEIKLTQAHNTLPALQSNSVGAPPSSQLYPSNEAVYTNPPNLLSYGAYVSPGYGQLPGTTGPLLLSQPTLVQELNYLGPVTIPTTYDMYQLGYRYAHLPTHQPYDSNQFAHAGYQSTHIPHWKQAGEADYQSNSMPPKAFSENYTARKNNANKVRISKPVESFNSKDAGKNPLDDSIGKPNNFKEKTGQILETPQTFKVDHKSLKEKSDEKESNYKTRIKLSEKNHPAVIQHKTSQNHNYEPKLKNSDELTKSFKEKGPKENNQDILRQDQNFNTGHYSKCNDEPTNSSKENGSVGEVLQNSLGSKVSKADSVLGSIRTGKEDTSFKSESSVIEEIHLPPYFEAAKNTDGAKTSSINLQRLNKEVINKTPMQSGEAEKKKDIFTEIKVISSETDENSKEKPCYKAALLSQNVKLPNKYVLAELSKLQKQNQVTDIATSRQVAKTKSPENSDAGSSRIKEASKKGSINTKESINIISLEKHKKEAVNKILINDCLGTKEKILEDSALSIEIGPSLPIGKERKTKKNNQNRQNKPLPVKKNQDGESETLKDNHLKKAEDKELIAKPENMLKEKYLTYPVSQLKSKEIIDFLSPFLADNSEKKSVNFDLAEQNQSKVSELNSPSKELRGNKELESKAENIINPKYNGNTSKCAKDKLKKFKKTDSIQNTNTRLKGLTDNDLKIKYEDENKLDSSGNDLSIFEKNNFLTTKSNDGIVLEGKPVLQPEIRDMVKKKTKKSSNINKESSVLGEAQDTNLLISEVIKQKKRKSEI
ncbi:hypothetical protein BY996DRAFT_6409007 [Phakopsora pachyrhizi]|nr:hypothetical protein BY996DRAFT_6409007 [Phakopsora pachyrhizi]